MVITRKKRFHLTDRVACIILAGGQGTRLFPLTKERCKPAVSFGGRFRLIDVPISNSLNSNMNQLFIISQYFSSNLNQYIKEVFRLDQFQGGSLSLLNPEERAGEKVWYEGTADAVRKNINELTKLPIDYFLILSGDQLYNMDLEAMISFSYKKNSDLTIAALPVGQVEANRLGLLNIDNHANIIDFYEKPTDPTILKRFQLSDLFLQQNAIHSISSPCFLASMGIYAFKKEILISLLAEDNRNDFGKHLIPLQLKKGGASAFLHQGYWEDIGTIPSFYYANLSLTTNSSRLNFYDEIFPIYTLNHYLPGARILDTRITNSIINDGSIVEAKEISHSIIGVRNVIQRGTVVRDSILLGNEYYSAPTHQDHHYTIGQECYIKNTIIDENVTIGNNVQLINKNKHHYYDSDGVFVRDGITIIASGTTLPNHFTF